MTALLDFLPLLAFFIAYKCVDLYFATAVAIGASAVILIYAKLRRYPVTTNQWVTFFMVVILGSLTLAFHDERYIKWKPTVVYWLLSTSCLWTHFFGSKVLVERLLGGQFSLPRVIWRQLNGWWISFFCFMGALNIYVFSHYPTSVWVNFKVFGALSLTLVFIIGQGIWLAKHQVDSIDAK